MTTESPASLTCQTCRFGVREFHRRFTLQGGAWQAIQFCRRYPVPVRTFPQYWCGEHQPKEPS